MSSPALARRLRLGDAVALGLGSMVGAGVFAVWAPAAEAAGGALLVGLAVAALTLGLGQFLLAFIRPLWIRLAIALAFVAPAALAGYHATHGIVKHTMPSDTWQIIFSVIGAVAVGVTALIRVTAMAAPGPTGQNVARA